MFRRCLTRIRDRCCRLLMIGLFCPVLPGAEPLAASQDSIALQQGKAIYRLGSLPDGPPLTALSQNVAMPAALFACVNCHRPSGLGSSEGGLLVPPITGAALFAPVEVKQRELYSQRTSGFYTRPAYNRATLQRAIVDGIGASGAPLNAVMPRYQLNPQQADSLIRYLESLDYSQPPGVSADALQIATIISDDVSPGRKQALLTTLQQYFKEKNAQTRHEARRVKYSPWHKNWHYDHYRRWELNVWELRGDPGSWPAQLAEYYRKNPVFAVVGGTSGQSWAPIHQFCESSHTPCLFPDTDLPDTQADNHYTLYLSAGMSLEARRVLQFMTAHPEYHEIIQVIDDQPRSSAAAQLLAQQASGRWPVTTLTLSELTQQGWPAPPAAQPLRILWLGNDALTRWPAMLSPPPSERLILSATLLEESLDSIPTSLQTSAWLISPYSLPSTPARLRRSKTWLQVRDIATPHIRLQANTYLALGVLTEALMHIRSNFSREYLIERIEHMLENSPTTSVYPRLSLAPGQRYAAKGSYLIPLDQLQLSVEAARPYWSVPPLPQK